MQACSEVKSFLPFISPFITIFLGILCIPLIEIVKKKHEQKRLLKALIKELKVQITISDLNLKLLKQVFLNAVEIYQGNKPSNNKLIYPGEIKYYTLEKLLENHYENLEDDTGINLKHIKELADGLNAIDENLNTLYKDVYFAKDPDQVAKKYLVDNLHDYISNLMYNKYILSYSIDVLSLGKSPLKSFTSLSHGEIINIQLLKENDEILNKHFLQRT